MIRINQLKLSIHHTEQELKDAVYKKLRVSPEVVYSISIRKQSIDARKKTEIKYIYAIDVLAKDENKIVKRVKDANVALVTDTEYTFTIQGNDVLKERPIVVGSGPAGLFCAYYLAKNGYQPILIERGEAVEERIKTVDQFWLTDCLDTESNVQFGEGGAGTFSDGKLNTMVKDTTGRIREVLKVFVEHGAPEEILYKNKPHIGTDVLSTVVRNIREDIKACGGSIYFDTKLTDIEIDNRVITGIEITKRNRRKLTDGVISSEGSIEKIPCSALILALGHSARDTFEMLYRRGLTMEKKAFAVGVRMEHKQELISKNQYGAEYVHLSAADYKVTHQCKNGRGVYSFCMCPGGYVVNASSEEGRLVVNGMSYHDRAGENANSAIIVTVGPEDFKKIPGAVDTPLAGMEFQRYYEELAYQTGRGKVPVQRFGDLLRNQESDKIGHIKPNIRGNYSLANLRECLPDYMIESILEGVQAFDKSIPGFADEDAIMSGVEMRTSSPLRIMRDETLESNRKGIYPCGEGAGYAGGIVSAAVDGIKVYEALAAKYRP
ncbi:NAD(P)/FAD-dependent oxidoreductase [Lachnoclostridium phytofermentans]|uniref:NAD(P)/FAD-dependent oxidoreductase n=1 Tax=Lachnoclostridium phytofermentans TaxID=66219 RepID=UPI000497BCE8|nr:NAD(P)-binding protein [Lachnoclostridium phytofermentans]